MPTSGKSTVGAELAGALGVPLVDTDDVIVEQTGKLVREIFTDDGEAAFRALEEQVVRDVLGWDDCVVSLGGGAILSATTRAALAGATVVWLEVSVKVATRRAGLASLRPLLLGDVRARLEALLAERSHLYEEVASLRLTTDRASARDLAEQILAWLKETGR
jgi:shikimate kinase